MIKFVECFSNTPQTLHAYLPQKYSLKTNIIFHNNIEIYHIAIIYDIIMSYSQNLTLRCQWSVSGVLTKHSTPQTN